MRAASKAMGAAIGCILLTIALLSPAWSQSNLAGSWIVWGDQDNKIRYPGPDPGSFLGLPINEAARAAALAYTPDNINELQRQCAPWPIHYIVIGPMPIEIWPTRGVDGKVIAWNLGGSIDQDPTTIWMDGRPPPSPLAAHSATGFTSGRWEGDTLVTTTTHIRDGYLYRNGVPSSDSEIFTMFITRHDDYLIITGIVHDPVYLTAPYVLTAVYSSFPQTEVGYKNTLNTSCTPVEELENERTGTIPHYLTTPEDTLMFATRKHGIPQEAALGGEQTMYPEYIKTLKGKYKQPEGYCAADCCGSLGADGKTNRDFNISVLNCPVDPNG